MLKLTLMRSLPARIAFHAVRQPGGEHNQLAVIHREISHPGIFTHRLFKSRHYRVALRSRVFKCERVGARLSLHIVHAAQKTVGMRMQPMTVLRRADVGPTCVNLEGVLVNLEKFKHFRRRAMYETV